MDKVGNSGEKKKLRGRPTKVQQIEIQKDIRQFFDDGYSANYCIQKTGHAKDTVNTYYKEWAEELIDKTDFISQQQEAKVRLVASLDSRIQVYNDQLTFLLNKRTNKFNPALENTINKTNFLLSKLHIDKANVLLTATLDISLRKLIKEKWGIDIASVAIEQTTSKDTGI